MATSSDQSLSGLFQSIYTPNQYYRPVQIFYWAFLFWTFGPNAAPCHIVNAAVLILTVVVFYFTLLRLHVPRYLAVAIPLVYGIIPNYSTVRLWFSAYENILSVLLYLISLYSDVRSLESPDKRAWLWKLLSLVSLSASLLAYEVILPLFFLNTVILWFYCKRHPSASWNGLQWTNVILVMLIISLKSLTPQRTGSNSLIHAAFIVKQFLKPNYGLFEYGFNPIQALKMNFGYYVVGLPYIVVKIARQYANAASFGIAGVSGSMVFAYMFHILKRDRTRLFDSRKSLIVALAGIILFALGYSIFLTNSNVQFSLAGIGNRTAVAASLGVAVFWIGVIGCVSSLLRSNTWQRITFCILTAFVCFSGILINNTIASFWMTSYQKQKAVLADIRNQFPSLPSGTAILIDGICPYEGPAVVFESRWDLAGVLKMTYEDHSIRGDIVTPKLSIEKDALSTALYGRIFYTRYTFGENLWIYNVKHRKAVQILDIKTARQYFREYNRNFNAECPQGHEGHGVAIF